MTRPACDCRRRSRSCDHRSRRLLLGLCARSSLSGFARGRDARGAGRCLCPAGGVVHHRCRPAFDAALGRPCHSGGARAGAPASSRARLAPASLRAAAGAAGDRRHPRHRRGLRPHRLARSRHRHPIRYLRARRHPAGPCVLQHAAGGALLCNGSTRSRRKTGGSRHSSASVAARRFRLRRMAGAARGLARHREPHLPPLRGKLRRGADARRRARRRRRSKSRSTRRCASISIRRARPCWRIAQLVLVRAIRRCWRRRACRTAYEHAPALRAAARRSTRHTVRRVRSTLVVAVALAFVLLPLVAIVVAGIAADFALGAIVSAMITSLAIAGGAALSRPVAGLAARQCGGARPHRR